MSSTYKEYKERRHRERRFEYEEYDMEGSLDSNEEQWSKEQNNPWRETGSETPERFRRRQDRERYHTTSVDQNTLKSISMATTTTTGSGKLAQEIHDEFLTCKICLEGYKNPKCLDCLHTFCEQCIDNHVMSECTYKKYSDYREFTCPLCRKRTQLPIGGVKKLPDNFLVSNLSELVVRQRPSKFPFCDICKLVNRKHREATSKCLDCNKLLCKPCVDLHRETKVTKNHSIFDCEIEKDIECKEHKEEAVRFYCEPCETCICVLCTFNEHKDHEITQFSDAVVKYKETIQQLLDSCKAKISGYDTQLATLAKCEVLIKAAEQTIRDTAIQFIADVRSREKELIDNLHDFFGAELMEHVDNRSELQANIDGLKSTCSLTEIVLKGKDIELLLLKKQVQEKLSSLNNIELTTLPNSVQKHVTFTPGTMDLGKLEDLDVPKKGLERTLSSPGTIRHGNIRSASVQTEKEEPPPKPRMIDEVQQTDAEVESESDSVFSNTDDKATETDVIETIEKAVNTRSRSLISHQSASVDSASTERPERVDSQNGYQEAPAEEQVRERRHRRRRERQRNEVPASATTYANSTDTQQSERGGPHLSYSSSIDENYYSPDGVQSSGRRKVSATYFEFGTRYGPN